MEADRRRSALLARVYGRHPDLAAVEELRVLLGASAPALPVVEVRPVRRRRVNRVLLSGAVALSAVVLASAAWGIGTVGGPLASAAPSAPATSAPVPVPTLVQVKGPAGSTLYVDAATGRVITFFDPSGACSTGEPDNDASCAAAQGYQQMLRVRSRAEALAARPHR
jgi:hypothetical protein